MPAADDRFSVMGGEATVTVVASCAQLADRFVAGARRRLDELEACWSRFRPDSELCRLNRRAGSGPVPVSDDLLVLVAAMVDAWRTTAGWYDPTVLAALVALGYDRPFADIAAGPDSSGPASICSAGRAPGLRDVLVDRSRRHVTLPADVTLDPGGIGKGLAADLVVDELRWAGADGALVNLGGDLRVSGTSPRGAAWRVGIEAPGRTGGVLGTVALDGDGAVATSGIHERRWHRGGEAVHHVIDPQTGAPTASSLVQVTVVGDRASCAEALSTAALAGGPSVAAALLGRDRHGSNGAVLVGVDGRITRLGARMGGRTRPRRPTPSVLTPTRG